MSTVTTTKSEFDSYSPETVTFSSDQRAYAQELAWNCSDEIDKLWFAMFDQVQKETGLNDEDTYLLIQKVLYRP